MSESNVRELFSRDMCRCCLSRTDLQNIYGKTIVDGEIVSLDVLFHGVLDSTVSGNFCCQIEKFI